MSICFLPTALVGGMSGVVGRPPHIRPTTYHIRPTTYRLPHERSFEL
jgi:hypothetical protein